MNSTTKPVEPLRPTSSKSAEVSVSSAALLRGATLLEVEHAGQIYILRVTRENKLILTK
jgi:hemin uptake protein HemP